MKPSHPSSSSARRRRVLVAGVGGASLGTEVVKALVASDRYDVHVADVSPFAFGLYLPNLATRTVLREDRYLDDLIALCARHRIEAVVPGAEITLQLVHSVRGRLGEMGVACALNTSSVIDVCTDKGKTFGRLSALGVPIPKYRVATCEQDLVGCPMPCVIKPATGSGGSAMVSPASTPEEALMYARWIWSAGREAIIQEYLPIQEGEYTVGVLTLGDWVGSIAMRREFPSKLSYVTKTSRYLISTGCSQGLVEDYPDVRHQAEHIARVLGSEGPLNVQGRLVGGRLVPFEVSPRFSATTYLRYMAGFREIDLFIDYLLDSRVPTLVQAIAPGYYFRSLTEAHVPTREILREP
jgi:carbamoyl-phosphate synthase large subunit